MPYLRPGGMSCGVPSCRVPANSLSASSSQPLHFWLAGAVGLPHGLPCPCFVSLHTHADIRVASSPFDARTFIVGPRGRVELSLLPEPPKQTFWLPADSHICRARCLIRLAARSACGHPVCV